jgi:hypothetical protein
MSEKTRDPKIQGEGDYESARRYRKDVKRFVEENDTEELAREAEPHNEQEVARCSMRSAKVAHDQRSASPKTAKRSDRRPARSLPGLRCSQARERSAPRTGVEC